MESPPSRKASGAPASDRSAGVPPAVVAASRPRFGEINIRDRGRLPHWEPGQNLATVIRSWKRDCYDRLLRDEAEFERALCYVADNPAQAQLGDWKWVWVCGRDARPTAAEDGGATAKLNSR
jgi:hypothetical protein